MVFTLCVGGAHIAAQNKIDSLETAIKSLGNSAEKASILSELCWEYRNVDQQKAIYYGREAIKIAEHAKLEKELASAYNDLSIIYIDLGSFDTAISLLNKDLILRSKLDDAMGVAAIHNKLGIIYQNTRQLKEAVYHTLEALSYFEEVNHTLYITYCLNNLAVLNYDLRNFKESEKRHLEILEIRKNLGDSLEIGVSYSNLSSVRLDLKDTLQAINDLKQALLYLNNSDNDNEKATALHNLGSIYLLQGKLNEAEKHLEKALELRKKINQIKGICSTSLNLGELYAYNKSYNKAINLLKNAYSLSIEHDLEDEEMFYYQKMGILYTQMNKADSAFKYLMEYQRLRNMRYESDLEKQILELETRYETQKKERALLEEQNKSAELTKDKALAELKAANRSKWILILVGFILLVLMAAILLMQRNKRIAQAEKDEAIIFEQEKSIQAVIQAQEEERKRIAKELHDGIVQELTTIKMGLNAFSNRVPPENQDEIKTLALQLDKSTKETREISHQMMPLALRELGLLPAIEDMFSRSFEHVGIRYEINHKNLEERLPEKIEISLFRIVQELVNNTIKHSKANLVELTLNKNENSILMVFEDNGIGYNTDQAHNGLGINNLNSRVKFVNGVITLESSKDNGSSAIIRIPI